MPQQSGPRDRGIIYLRSLPDSPSLSLSLCLLLDSLSPFLPHLKSMEAVPMIRNPKRMQHRTKHTSSPSKVHQPLAPSSLVSVVPCSLPHSSLPCGVASRAIKVAVLHRLLQGACRSIRLGHEMRGPRLHGRFRFPPPAPCGGWRVPLPSVPRGSWRDVGRPVPSVARRPGLLGRPAPAGAASPPCYDIM